MDCYIDRTIALNLAKRLQAYFSAQRELQRSFGIDIMSDNGRRNIVMSHAQEQFLCDELRKKFTNVIADGRAGAVDIFVSDIGRELECKITSMTGKGAVLQTDYNTLSKKGSLDYLYVITDNEDLKKFAIIFFCGLTPDDFRLPSPGSKGKTQMKRLTAMPKATFLLGGLTTSSDKWASKVEVVSSNLDNRCDAMRAKLADLEKSLTSGIDPRSGDFFKNWRRKQVRQQADNLRETLRGAVRRLRAPTNLVPKKIAQEKFYIELESIE